MITDIESYLCQLSTSVPSYLEAIEKEAKENGFPYKMLSGSYQGRFLSFVSKLISPRFVLDIGSFLGYSSLCLAEGLLDNGLVISIEKQGKWASIARENIKKSPYQHVIELIEGEAMEVITRLDYQFDLVFIDADKYNYLNYFNLVLSKMKKGGIILSDNVLWRREVIGEEKEKMSKKAAFFHSYNKILKDHPNLEVIILPIRDGLSMARVF